MNNTERFEYFESGVLQHTTQMELLDWAGYWMTAGLEPIEDPLQREQTRVAINMILVDGGQLVQKVSRMAISYDVFLTKTAEQITDADVRTVIVNIMASKLGWITGIWSI